MKLLRIKRKTRLENRYGPKMGRVCCRVTRIKLYFLGIPIKTYHEYRETYYGEIKELVNCKLNK